MIQRIENSETVLVGELRNQYPDNWFCYVILEEDEDVPYIQPELRKAKVIWTADSRKELLELSLKGNMFLDFSFGSISYGKNVSSEIDPTISRFCIEPLEREY